MTKYEWLYLELVSDTASVSFVSVL